MTSANRLRLTFVRETTPGTTPTTPRMRTARITGESLAYNPEYVTSDEIRDDRMIADAELVMKSSGGGINVEMSYPVDETFLSEMIRSAMENTWSNTPQRYNDGTADSVITAVDAASDTFTVTTGAAFVEGQLVRATGFTNAGNNLVFRAQSGSGALAAVAPSSPGLTDESAPPGTARLKVIGFQGASGDITATATGLGSTALDFTTLGLAVGMAVKIGGSATGDKFATAACNGWARITAIAATALTLDNLPDGWTTDAGTGKTIKVFFGDQIKNGTTQTSFTFERGFMGQSTPSYLVNKGMRVGQMQVEISAKQKITMQFTFSGTGGSASATSLDASPDDPTTSPILVANVDVGRVTENGATLGAPNYIKALSFSVNNNLRMIEDIVSDSPVDIADGEATVTGRSETYFGDLTLYDKFLAGTVTSIMNVVEKSNQAVVIQLPRVKFTGGGNPQATGKNTDVMANFEFSASKSQDGTAAHVIIDRLEYVE